MVKEFPKVLGENIKEHTKKKKSSRAKTLNMLVGTIGLIICKWKIHGTTTGYPCTDARSNKIRKVREKSAVT